MELENHLAITDLLRNANLLQYETALLEQGADDIQQLIELSESDFQDLLHLIGMQVKPFHVMRFKKVLGRSKKSDEYTFDSNIPSLNTHTVTVYATQIDDETLPSSSSRSIVLSQKHQSNHLPLFQNNTRQSPPPLESITGYQFQSLVDDSVPVQKGLVPSPILPGIWDDGRKEIIRNASQSFLMEFSGQELSLREQSINEASYQLCLWDPTLLVRREELFKLAMKSVHLTSLMTSGSITDSQVENKKSRKERVSMYPVNRGSDGKFRACFESNCQLRDKQMKDFERLLTDNADQQQIKQTQLTEAKQKKDYSAALKLQEDITSLGQSHRHLKSELSHIRKIQRRSIRHQEIKRLKINDVEQKSTSTTCTFTPPNCTSLIDNPSAIPMISVITPTSFSEHMHSSSDFNVVSDSETQETESSLQLHTYISDNVKMTV